MDNTFTVSLEYSWQHSTFAPLITGFGHEGEGRKCSLLLNMCIITLSQFLNMSYYFAYLQNELEQLSLLFFKSENSLMMIINTAQE